MSPLSPEAGSWFLLDKAITCSLTPVASLAATIGTVVLTWLALTTGRAVVAEYIKRFWFRRVHPGEFEKAEKKLVHAEEKLKLQEEEFNNFKDKVEAVILENDRLIVEVIRLRLERRNFQATPHQRLASSCSCNYVATFSDNPDPISVDDAD